MSFDPSRPSVLVTGATGFIGREVVRRLLASGRSVVALARGRNGQPALERVAAAVGVPPDGRRLGVVEVDLTEPEFALGDAARRWLEERQPLRPLLRLHPSVRGPCPSLRRARGPPENRGGASWSAAGFRGRRCPRERWPGDRSGPAGARSGPPPTGRAERVADLMLRRIIWKQGGVPRPASRVGLGKTLIKKGRIAEARRELRVVLEGPEPRNPPTGR